MLMKQVISILVCGMCAFPAFAQNDYNTHYQWMEEYVRNVGEYSPHCMNPRRVAVPDIPGYHTYKADLHMHTIFSDAQVTPRMRVLEAWMENLDILAITDHHPAPRRGISDDMNAGYNEAKSVADRLDFKLIKGFEMTCSEPVGHINLLFLNDLNDYRMRVNSTTAECDSLLKKAVAEDAFITTNHPGWPDENSTLSGYIEERIKSGIISGIEVFNNKEFYPMAIDHANRYDLAMLGCTDSHYPTDYLYNRENNHRDMTLIFARDLSDESIKEALRAGRTIAWANNVLAGRENLLRTFLHACIKLEYIMEEENFVRFRLLNRSDIPFLFVCNSPQESIYVPANGYADTKRRKTSLQTSFRVENTYVTSTRHLEVPLSFLLQSDNEVCIPGIDERSISFSDKGMSFRLSENDGKTYYTLDGSEPDENSIAYGGGDITVSGPVTIKAVTVADGRKSDVYERRMTFSPAVKCRAKKNGVHFRYYENEDILSTTDIEKIGVLKKEGTYPAPAITDGEGKEHFGFVFTGFLNAPESGLYSFVLSTNDGSDLYIGGELACDNDQHNGYASSNGKIYLQKGFHPFRIRYFEGYGGESFDLQWVIPGRQTPEPVPAKVFYLE